jgi:FixJ family two-component response regulator
MPELIIIDDEVQFAEMLADVGEMNGYETLIFTEAKNFLQHQKETDIIFLDLTMPDIDGIEVITELSKRQCKAVLVLMSGFDEDLLQTAKQLAQGFGLTVVDTLTKPIKISDVSQLLENSNNTL